MIRLRNAACKPEPVGHEDYELRKECIVYFSEKEREDIYGMMKMEKDCDPMYKKYPDAQKIPVLNEFNQEDIQNGVYSLEDFKKWFDQHNEKMRKRPVYLERRILKNIETENGVLKQKLGILELELDEKAKKIEKLEAKIKSLEPKLEQ